MTEYIENDIAIEEQQDSHEEPSSQEKSEGKWLPKVLTLIGFLAVIALIVLGLIFLLNKENSDVTRQIRDVFIIFIALVSLIIGTTLVILIIQLATLINLLQNEIRPIINSTNETVNTLKGTVKFLSDNLTEPVIKINSFAAKIRQIIKPSKNK